MSERKSGKLLLLNLEITKKWIKASRDLKLFGSNETMIDRLVTSWEFDRGVEVFSPLSGWGDIVHQSSTGSQRFRRARVPPLPPSIEDLSPSSSISSTLQSSRRHLGFSATREPLLFFGIRGVDCIRSSASWPGYGGECAECHSPPIWNICQKNFKSRI